MPPLKSSGDKKKLGGGVVKTPPQKKGRAVDSALQQAVLSTVRCNNKNTTQQVSKQ
jgi:hypothetical protein